MLSSSFGGARQPTEGHTPAARLGSLTETLPLGSDKDFPYAVGLPDLIQGEPCAPAATQLAGHDSAFRGWRGMRPLDWRPGQVAALACGSILRGDPGLRPRPPTFSNVASRRRGILPRSGSAIHLSWGLGLSGAVDLVYRLRLD